MSLLCGRLFAGANGKAIVRAQLPLRLDDFSEPEPDFVVAKPRSDHYLRSHPVPAEALLVIEVSQSSQRFDRKRKLRLYARHEVPEYWIVDVVKPALHVFHGPQGERYLRSSSTPRPGLVALRTLPELEMDLTGLFELL